MNIALMSGAYINAGDFLIEERCRNLLKTNVTNANIDILKRNIAYDDQIDSLNEYDLIIFGGGPGFQKKLYPKQIPFVSDLNKIKPPIAIMGWGWGWKIRNNYLPSLYRKNYFSPDMVRFLSHISEQGLPIGCRDWYTVRMLKTQGFTNTIMTGCPAWYKTDLVKHLTPRNSDSLNKPNPTIAVSDAAYPENVKYIKILLETLKEIYPQSHVKILLHRGITKYNHWILELQNQTSAYEVTDISKIQGGGMEPYDHCDLHIGFRVHAHIYNLSIGNPSILISEDIRGDGVNDALGIQNIYPGKHLKRQLYDYFTYLNATEMRQYAQACHSIEFYYSAMENFIHRISTIQ